MMTSFNPLPHDASHGSYGATCRMVNLLPPRATFSIPEDSQAASVQDLTLQITQHPQFSHLFSSIKSCLQLSDHVWTAYSQLRASHDARLQLECLHPSIWHSPPEEIWTIIVHLRERPSFYNVQACVIADLESFYFRAYHNFPIRALQSPLEDGTCSGSAATTMLEPKPVHSQTFAETAGQDQDEMSVPQPELERQSTLASSFSESPNPRSTQRYKAGKQAPDGLWYHCPSEGCSKPYKRLGHYKKHLKRTHPDFGPRHPHHSALMSLKPRTSSGSSSQQPSEPPWPGAGQPSSVFDINTSQSRASFRSRRGSVLSSSSVDSAAASLLLTNSSTDASFFSTSTLSGTEAALLQDSSVWHMGGGAFS